LLFGSRARGDHQTDIDWDLCVLLPDDVRAGLFTPLTLWQTVSDLRVPLQIVPIRRSIFEMRGNEINSLSFDIWRDGIVLLGAMAEAQPS
jgi:predicted nucleotidyltransferase